MNYWIIRELTDTAVEIEGNIVLNFWGFYHKFSRESPENFDKLRHPQMQKGKGLLGDSPSQLSQHRVCAESADVQKMWATSSCWMKFKDSCSWACWIHIRMSFHDIKIYFPKIVPL
jgi:hypothetical protein